MSEERDNGLHVGHFPCPECLSENNLSVYLHQLEDGSEQYDGTCWTPGCKSYFSNDELVESGVLSGDFEVDKSKLPPKREPIDTDQWFNLRDRTKEFVQYRGIRSETMKFFGHRTEVDARGNITCIYYPETNSERSHDTVKSLMGFKSRVLPKQFGMRNVGLTGRSNELSGQHLFRNKTGKYILIVGGENDKAAGYQILKDSQRDSEYDSIPVVSPTTGEGSAYKQIADNYDFLDQFDWIVVGMDNDDAGHKATAAIVEHLPSEKVKIAKWSMKDPHSMLEAGKQKQMVRDFYSAKELVTSGIKTSKDADDEMEVELAREKIPLPPFMSELQKVMAGGIPLGYMVTIGAQTGGGKTTIVNEMLYYWIFNSPYKTGVVSLELNAGQYQATMLSRHINTKIHLIEDPKKAVEFVQQDWVKEKRRELREDDTGQERYVLLDDREGSLDTLKLQIEKLIRKYGCKCILIDPIQDAFEGSSLEEQTSFIKYLKSVIKEGIAIVVVAHITKGKTEIDKSTGKRVMRMLTEDDFAGVSNLAKSSGCTVLTMRDKYAEDPVEQNTTLADVGKCRWSGRTGHAGKWYYDLDTHTMYDFRAWLNGSDVEPVEVVDHSASGDNEESF